MHTRRIALTVAMILILGSLFILGFSPKAMAQGQDTMSPPSTNSTPANDTAVGQETPAAVPAYMGDSIYPPEDIRGTELEKSYQQQNKSGWQDPNITLSGNFDQAGGAQ